MTSCALHRAAEQLDRLTLVAADQCGRDAIGTEKDAEYHARAVKRLSELQGVLL